MNFGEALEELKKGNKIKRKHWGGYWYLDSVVLESHAYDGENYFIVAKLKEGGYAPAQAYQGDMLAEDWEVIDIKEAKEFRFKISDYRYDYNPRITTMFILAEDIEDAYHKFFTYHKDIPNVTYAALRDGRIQLEVEEVTND